MLRKSPTTTAAALVTLALGVGLNTGIVSVVKSILIDQNSVMRQLTQEHPNDYARGRTIRVALLLDQLIGPIRRALWMLFGAIALVLLIATAAGMASNVPLTHVEPAQIRIEGEAPTSDA